jgi:hypothetical protein
LTRPYRGSSIILRRPGAEGSHPAGLLADLQRHGPVRLPVSLLVLLGATLATGCAPRLAPPGGVAGAPAPAAAVERFLQLAAERDYGAMGWLFGTNAGPILRRDPVPEVEQRMYALASLLEHDSYVIGSGSPVPGRTGDAVRFEVVLRRGSQGYTVPFTTVRGPQQRWFVEQLAIEAITGR